MVPGDKDVCPYPVPLSHSQPRTLLCWGLPKQGPRVVSSFAIGHWKVRNKSLLDTQNQPAAKTGVSTGTVDPFMVGFPLWVSQDTVRKRVSQ